MNAAVVTEQSPTIEYGCTVVIEDIGNAEQSRYTIVSPPESNPLRGLLSEMSPLGYALLGRQVGDDVSYRAPGGRLTVRVISVAEGR